ncbi:GGDEF domain-containing protein [Halopseudomonas sp.]|uniref:GGDEF domain-containing protein n=1 Tax=Halopseudomonas sp. TaxID=2901191 RepID=UPI00356749A3
MFDINTLIVVLAVTSIVSVMGLLAASILNRQVRAIRYWAAGLSFFIVGLLLQVSSPPIPLWISAVVITQAYFVLWWGTRCYRNRDQNGFVPAMLGLFMIQAIVFFVLQESLRFSIMFHSAVVVVVCVLTIFELWRVSLLQRIVVWVWALIWGMHAVVYLRRFGLYLTDEAYINATDFQMAVSVEAINYLEGVAFIYGFSLMCVVLTTASLQNELKHQASRDPLTDLFNRRALEESALKALGMARRSGMPVTLLLMDLDRFKAINDEHGHKVGDQVLVAFAEHLNDHSRVPDLVCRFGGEEFLVLLPDTSLPEAQSIAERIRTGLEKKVIVTGKTSVKITVSIGVAELRDDEQDNLFDLVERADQALYQAKEQGRNRVQSWSRGLRMARVEGLF